MNILKPLCATFALATLFALSAGCGEDAQPAGEAPAEAKPIERTLDPVFAGQSEEEVQAFFNQKDAAALRERFRTSCAPNETVGGISLPCFCVAAGWPEAIGILKEVGYDLNTPATPKAPPTSPRSMPSASPPRWARSAPRMGGQASRRFSTQGPTRTPPFRSPSTKRHPSMFRL